MVLEMPNPEIQRFYAEARALEPTEAEVAGLVRRALEFRRKRRTRRRRAIVAIALAAATALSTAFVIPSARDALTRFLGGAAAPGAKTAAGSLPAWLTNASSLPVAHPTPGSERLLAEKDGQRLIAYRDATSDRACLAFGNDSDTCSDSAGWQRLFAGHALLKLASGVGPTADGKIAVFGIARSSIARVELRDGDTVVVAAPVTNGGWVVVAPLGTHDSLVALRSDGHPVETLDARGWTWTFCTQEAGC